MALANFLLIQKARKKQKKGTEAQKEKTEEEGKRKRSKKKEELRNWTSPFEGMQCRRGAQCRDGRYTNSRSIVGGVGLGRHRPGGEHVGRRARTRHMSRTQL